MKENKKTKFMQTIEDVIVFIMHTVTFVFILVTQFFAFSYIVMRIVDYKIASLPIPETLLFVVFGLGLSISIFSYLYFDGFRVMEENIEKRKLEGKHGKK